MPPPLVTLTFDLLTLKVVSESRVTWSLLPILVSLGVSVLDLGPMYATDRRQSDKQTDRQTSDVRQHHRLMPPPRGRGIIIRCRRALVNLKINPVYVVVVTQIFFLY